MKTIPKIAIAGTFTLMAGLIFYLAYPDKTQTAQASNPVAFSCDTVFCPNPNPWTNSDNAYIGGCVYNIYRLTAKGGGGGGGGCCPQTNSNLLVINNSLRDTNNTFGNGKNVPYLWNNTVYLEQAKNSLASITVDIPALVYSNPFQCSQFSAFVNVADTITKPSTDTTYYTNATGNSLYITDLNVFINNSTPAVFYFKVGTSVFLSAAASSTLPFTYHFLTPVRVPNGSNVTFHISRLTSVTHQVSFNGYLAVF